MGLPILIAVVGLGIRLDLITLLANVLGGARLARHRWPRCRPRRRHRLRVVPRLAVPHRAAQRGEPQEAVVTRHHPGRGVIFAGITVFIALLGMFVMNLGFLAGVAIGCSTRWPS